MRYFRISILIGIIVGAAVLTLYHMNLLRPLDQPFQQAFGLPDFMAALRWPYQYALIPLLALAIAWTTVDITRPGLKLLIAIGALLQILITSYTLSLYNHFFTPTGPLLAVAGSLFFGLIYSRTNAGKRKRQLRNLFGRRIGEKTFRKLLNDKEAVHFNGHKRQISVVVIEIFNHKELLEALQPEDSFTLINQALANASHFLVEKGAYLDECNGEGLRGFFGTPLADKDHATTAVQAALELDQQMKNLNLELDARWHQTLDYRIAVSSGEVITGTYGTSRLGGFSATGEPLDFARRLCAANTLFGTRILIDPDTYDLAQEQVEVRPVEMLRGAGEGDLVEIYEPLGLSGTLDECRKQSQRLFWEGVIFYREHRWQDARNRFSEVLKMQEQDAVSDFYLKRIEKNTGESLSEHHLPYGLG